MYLETIGEQGRLFLYSCGFGFFLSALFDAFEFAGELLPKRKAVYIVRDVIYMVLCTFLLFLFSLAADDGSFKFHIYAGSLVGWLVYYFSLGFFTRSVRKIISSLVKRCFTKFGKLILSIILKLKEKRAKKSKKNKISSNLLLQDNEMLLYNKKENSDVSER